MVMAFHPVELLFSKSLNSNDMLVDVAAAEKTKDFMPLKTPAVPLRLSPPPALMDAFKLY